MMPKAIPPPRNPRIEAAPKRKRNGAGLVVGPREARGTTRSDQISAITFRFAAVSP